MSSVLEVYRKFDIEVNRAEGRYLWDTSGRRYTDMFSGLAVTNFGHRPPAVVEAVNRSMETYAHLSNLFPERNQEELADEIARRVMPGGKVFFCNSGAEANETAVKAARKYFDGEKYEVISFLNSFHGRTLAMLGATGQAGYRDGFGPLPEGFLHAEYNFLAAVEDKVGPKTCAVIAEVIQGEGGVIPAERDFIRGLRKFCDENHILLIIDEIQTGMGRTGSFCGYEHYGITPDIVTMGKALGGGLPLAACIMNPKTASALKPGDHGSTFGGNPVCCAAALASVRMITPELLQEVENKGRYLMESLKGLSEEFERIRDIRGRGLMVGMDLDMAGSELVKYLLEKGYIANCTRESVIRFLPPFIIEKEDIDGMISAAAEYFREII